MGTTIRAKISEKNKYWVSKHRYYELKHYCLQYKDWERSYIAIDGLSAKALNQTVVQTSEISNPTVKYAEAKIYFSNKMNMIEKAAEEADPELSCYILKAVTEGYSYDYLKTVLEIPCCKETYYQRYRKFFWILSELRD